MDRLWARDEPATVRELHTDLSAQRRLAYTTVLTVVDNLYKKGWLRREPAGRAFRYRPVTSREEYSARLMHEALDASGKLAAVIAHERAHAAGRHHLLIAALRLLRDAFPASRLFSQAHAEVSRLVEERADDTATRHHNPLDLARALVTIAEGTAHDPANRAPAAPAPALGAAGGEAAARVHRLINPPAPPCRRVAILLSLIAAALPLVPLGLAAL